MQIVHDIQVHIGTLQILAMLQFMQIVHNIQVHICMYTKGTSAMSTIHANTFDAFFIWEICDL